MKQIFSLAMLLLVCAACVTQKENIPAWLAAPQKEYPQGEYLVSLGEGDTRRAAENSAAAGLSRIFQSQINSSESLSETTTESRGTESTFGQVSELRSDVRIGSDQTLLNVQFGESFTDPHGRVHVAALIPRAETAEIYRNKISEINRRITFLVQRSDAAPDPIKRYAFRRAASRKAHENDLLLEQLRIIHPQACAAVALNYDPQTLYTATAGDGRNITFTVKMENSIVRNALVKMLAAMGFSENAADPMLEFSGTTSFERMDMKREGLIFVRWNVNIEMQAHFDNPSLSLKKTSREGHISFEEARARAERAAAAEIDTRLRQELEQYFDRLAAAEK